MAQEISVAQRASLFAQATRQNLQMLPPQTATGGAQTLQFNLPKARLLSGISLDVEAVITGSGSAWATTTMDEFTPYKLIRRISLDLNNGFSPYTIGGVELALYNAIRMNSQVIYPQTSDEHGYCYAKSDKTKFNFTVELPVTLSAKDPIGLILLQNAETNVQLTVDIANGNDVFDNKENVVVNINSVKVTPCLETFSIPAITDAFPDLSVLKIVNSRIEGFMGAGQNIIKLPTGTIYRKLIIRVCDEKGVPFEDADFLSNIDLVFNQADVNYSVRAQNLRHRNELELGHKLPKGCFAFDFSSSGFLPNMGGTRDFIDSEKLTEFWIRFNSSKKGKVSVITEQIARLK